MKKFLMWCALAAAVTNTSTVVWIHYQKAELHASVEKLYQQIARTEASILEMSSVIETLRVEDVDAYLAYVDRGVCEDDEYEGDDQ